MNLTDAMDLQDVEIGNRTEIRLTQRRFPGDQPQPTVEQWQATGILIFTGDTDGVDADVDVVRVEMVRCPLGDPDMSETLDALHVDLGDIGIAVLDGETGYASAAVDKLSGAGGYMLIVHTVTSSPRFAGRGMRRWVVAEAIQAMKPGIAFVATLAEALNHPKGESSAEARRKRREAWGSIGFVHVKDDVMVLNPDLSNPVERMKDLRERFGLPRD